MAKITTKERGGGSRLGVGRPKENRKVILFQVRCNEEERQVMIKVLNEYRIAKGLRPYVPRTK